MFHVELNWALFFRMVRVLQTYYVNTCHTFVHCFRYTFLSWGNNKFVSFVLKYFYFFGVL
jgi:hypothetical protein